ITHTTEEVIMKQSIFKSFAKYRQEYSSYGLTFHCTVGKIVGVRRVSRAVYEAFVEPVPKKMVILHKNDDPFDNSVENLYPATLKEKSKKTHEKNREAINRKQGLTAEVTVSQYDLKGNYINTFNSLTQAGNALGINSSNLTTVLNGKRLSAGGYYWQKGDSKTKLDISLLEERLKQIKRESSLKRSKKIIQYNLTGKYMATYSSIKEAVEKTGLSRDAIEDVLKEKRSLNREFIWKYADSFEVVPNKIYVEKYKLPKPAFIPKSRKELNLPEYEYPYQDINLHNIENEVWKVVPGFEEYCMVSNLGRVKTLPRFVDRPNHGRIVMKERIIKQGLRKFERTGTLNKCLYFAIGIDNKMYQMAVARAVYSAFIKPLRDFKDDNIFILHRDLNPLNNRVENLYAATRRETAKRNNQGRFIGSL
ncbi:MAG: HNH endonuclease, partial [Candidatus Azobacteroides sp.]|nr:HNH endonuclease [Candidatus Azobacteroides sp.]